MHGGGPQINAHLDRLGIESTFTAGLRVTTPEAMQVVRMVLVGQVNRDVVGLINRHGPFAVGMSGEDAHLFTAVRKHAVVDGEPVDIGQVGDIVKVEAGAVRACSTTAASRWSPAIARSDDGTVYNVNADTAAAALAVALGRRKLIVLTDVEGLYPTGRDGDDVIASSTRDRAGDAAARACPAAWCPKMEACLTAVRGGVPQAHVLDGRVPHSLLLEIFTDEGIGTMVLPDAPSGPTHAADASRGSDSDLTVRDGRARTSQAAFMPNYGVPAAGAGARRGRQVWDVDGTRVPRPDRRHRRQLARPRPPGRWSRPSRPGRHARAHQQPVPARAGGAARRAAARPARRARPGLLHQLRHRGQRGRPQAGRQVRQADGRSYFVAAENGFHGRTLGALALTGKPSIRDPFGPLPATSASSRTATPTR